MLTHVVLFRLNDGADAQEVVARLRSLEGKVPAIRALEAGVNQVESDRSYDVGLIVHVDDLAALEAYQVDPYHQEVVAFIKSVATQSVAADFTP